MYGTCNYFSISRNSIWLHSVAETCCGRFRTGDDACEVQDEYLIYFKQMLEYMSFVVSNLRSSRMPGFSAKQKKECKTNLVRLHPLSRRNITVRKRLGLNILNRSVRKLYATDLNTVKDIRQQWCRRAATLAGISSKRTKSSVWLGGVYW